MSTKTNKKPTYYLHTQTSAKVDLLGDNNQTQNSQSNLVEGVLGMEWPLDRTQRSCKKQNDVC